MRAVKITVVLLLVTFTLAVTPDPIKIEFTDVPSAGEGPDSRGDIAGRVQNLKAPSSYKIVLYAHTDAWYVQPTRSQPLTDIAADGTWSNWTHLGHRYAALVVRPSYKPPAKIEDLPGIGENVIAKAEIKAK